MLSRLLITMSVLWSPCVLSLVVSTVEPAVTGTSLISSVLLWGVWGLVGILGAGGLFYAIMAQRRLRDHTAYMQRIWDVFPDALTKVDGKGVIIEVNHGADRCAVSDDTDTLNSEVGQYYTEHLSLDEKALFEQHLSYALSSGQVSQYEFTHTINDKTYSTHNRIVPLWQATERVALVINTDITAYKEGQTILLHDKRQCQQALKSKTQLLSNISDKMRPTLTTLNSALLEIQQGYQLTPVVTDSSVVDESALSAVVRPDPIRQAKASIETLGNLLDDMAMRAELSAHQSPAESVSTSLWHVMDDLEALTLRQAQELNIQLSIDHDILPHHIKIDGFRLRQILYNLMGCHLAICENDALKMTVQQTQLAHEPMLQFTLMNDVDPAQQHNWIGLFNNTIGAEQLDLLASESVAAFRICKDLVAHLHGVSGAKSTGNGRIEHWCALPLHPLENQSAGLRVDDLPIVLAIESQAQRAWFQLFFQSLKLPFVDIETGADLPQKISLLVSDYSQSTNSDWLWWLGDDYTLTESHGIVLHRPFRRESLYYQLMDYQTRVSKTPHARQPAKILLVEDNPNNQLVIKRTLEKLGYDVIVANNGEEGVALFKTAQVECVIMDIQMPIMDGIEATRHIRKLDTPYVPVIALTANSQKDIEEACFAVGMDRFLTKPISRQVIQDTLEDFLGRA